MAVPHHKIQSSRSIVAAVICGAALACLGPAQAADITMSGAPVINVDAGDLIGGAGTDLAPTHDVGGMTMTIVENTAWQVTVYKSDGNWSPGLTLSVVRTSNGTGPGSVAGGLAYVAIPDAPSQVFCTGTGDLANIGVGLRLGGMSVSVPPDTYDTQITFTVVDL